MKEIAPLDDDEVVPAERSGSRGRHGGVGGARSGARFGERGAARGFGTAGGSRGYGEGGGGSRAGGAWGRAGGAGGGGAARERECELEPSSSSSFFSPRGADDEGRRRGGYASRSRLTYDLGEVDL